MSLNEISLPARMVADLYNASLIELVSPNKHKSIKFLGKNEKNILILVAQEDVAFLNDDELNFLSSVLTACKLSLADVAIVNLHATPNSNYRFFLDQFKSKTILLFDVDSQKIDLPFNFPHFQLQQFDNSTYLSAPSLQFIEKQKALKTQLWNCLKTIFLPNT